MTEVKANEKGRSLSLIENHQQQGRTWCEGDKYFKAWEQQQKKRGHLWFKQEWVTESCCCEDERSGCEAEY